jgi:hypothetical protein
MPMAPLDQRGAARGAVFAVSTADSVRAHPDSPLLPSQRTLAQESGGIGTIARGYSGRLRGKPAPERAAKGDPGRCEAASRLALVTYKYPSP